MVTYGDWVYVVYRSITYATYVPSASTYDQYLAVAAAAAAAEVWVCGSLLSLMPLTHLT